MTAPTRTRRLTDDELSPWAVKRGEWNDDADRPSALPAMFCAAFVGGLMWVALIWIARAVYAAFTGDPSMMEF